MTGTKNGAKSRLIDAMIRETSGRIMRAMALGAQDSAQGAVAEWLGAAEREEQVACLLEAENRDIEAAVHYVSAASCHAKVQQYSRAVPLLRAALSFSLREAYRREIEELLKDWLPKAKKQLRRQARKQPVPVS